MAPTSLVHLPRFWERWVADQAQEGPGHHGQLVPGPPSWLLLMSATAARKRICAEGGKCCCSTVSARWDCPISRVQCVTRRKDPSCKPDPHIGILTLHSKRSQTEGGGASSERGSNGQAPAAKQELPKRTQRPWLGRGLSSSVLDVGRSRGGRESPDIGVRCQVWHSPQLLSRCDERAGGRTQLSSEPTSATCSRTTSVGFSTSEVNSTLRS